MKWAILAAAVLVLVLFLPTLLGRRSAPQHEVDTEGMKALVAQLDELGFFKYVPPEEVEAVKKDVVQSGIPGLEETRRFFLADEETIIEQGIKGLLADIAPFLRLQGVELAFERSLVTMKDRDTTTGQVIDVQRPIGSPRDIPGSTGVRVTETLSDDGTYIVEVDGRRYVVNSPQMDQLEAVEHASATFLLIINTLLEQAGSPERAYMFAGWNDAYIVFMTPEMADVMKASTALAHDSVRPGERKRLAGFDDF